MHILVEELVQNQQTTGKELGMSFFVECKADLL